MYVLTANVCVRLLDANTVWRYRRKTLRVKLSAQWWGNVEVTEALKDGAVSARVIFILGMT